MKEGTKRGTLEYINVSYVYIRICGIDGTSGSSDARALLGFRSRKGTSSGHLLKWSLRYYGGDTRVYL